MAACPNCCNTAACIASYSATGRGPRVIHCTDNGQILARREERQIVRRQPHDDMSFRAERGICFWLRPAGRAVSHTPASEDEARGQYHPRVGPNGGRAVSTRHASRVGSANIPSGLSGCCVLATFLLRLPAQSASFLRTRCASADSPLCVRASALISSSHARPTGPETCTSPRSQAPIASS